MKMILLSMDKGSLWNAIIQLEEASQMQIILVQLNLTQIPNNFEHFLPQ